MPYSKLVTAKTHEDIAKRKRKVKNDGSAFLHFLYLFKHIHVFLGCRCLILISETIFRFFFPWTFQRRIRNCSTAKPREDIVKRKQKTMVRLFFIFWIRSNIFCNFLGCRRLILISETIIRFDCPLAFQCRIPNYSTAKITKIWRKENRKLKMIAQLFFIFWIRSNIFCEFSGCRCSILISEIVIRFVFPLAF